MADAKRPNTMGYIACGHWPSWRNFPCSENVGHYGPHQNAHAGWERQPDDDCPPFGTFVFVGMDVQMLREAAIMCAEPDNRISGRLDRLAERISALVTIS